MLWLQPSVNQSQKHRFPVSTSASSLIPRLSAAVGYSASSSLSQGVETQTHTLVCLCACVSVAGIHVTRSQPEMQVGIDIYSTRLVGHHAGTRLGLG